MSIVRISYCSLTISQETNALEDVLDDNRLEHVQLRSSEHTADENCYDEIYLELAACTRNTDSSLVAHDLRCNHGEGLALRRVHLSGHNATAGLVLWQAELPETTPRARAKVPDVVRDLHQRASDDVQGAVRLNERVMSSKSLELVRGGLELDAGELGDLSSDLHVEAFPGVQALA